MEEKVGGEGGVVGGGRGGQRCWNKAFAKKYQKGPLPDKSTTDLTQDLRTHGAGATGGGGGEGKIEWEGRGPERP